jgi:hypothetical protein
MNSPPIGIVIITNHKSIAQIQLASLQGCPVIISDIQPPIELIITGERPIRTISNNPKGNRVI